MHFLYVAIRLLSMTTDFYVWFHAKGLKLQDSEEDLKKQQQDEEEAEKAAGRESITMDVIAE